MRSNEIALPTTTRSPYACLPSQFPLDSFGVLLPLQLVLRIFWVDVLLFSRRNIKVLTTIHVLARPKNRDTSQSHSHLYTVSRARRRLEELLGKYSNHKSWFSDSIARISGILQSWRRNSAAVTEEEEEFYTSRAPCRYHYRQCQH